MLWGLWSTRTFNDLPAEVLERNKGLERYIEKARAPAPDAMCTARRRIKSASATLGSAGKLTHQEIRRRSRRHREQPAIP